MSELDRHRKTWQGKSDEWLFERLALELKDKVSEIHSLVGQNDKLRLQVVSNHRQILLDFAEYSENDKTSISTDECVDNYLDNSKTIEVSIGMKSKATATVIRTSDGKEFNVNKIVFPNPQNNQTSVWCNDWYGRHVIGQDCEKLTIK